MSDAIREGSTVSGILTKVVVVVLRNRGDSRPDAVGVDAAGSGVPKEFLDGLPVLRGSAIVDGIGITQDLHSAHAWPALKGG